MSEVKSGCFYTKEHEWITLEENVITIGITDYAQQSLGDIVFVDLPSVDEEITKDESFGVVESVKAVSDLYSPVTGKILEVNDVLSNSPEIVNNACFDEGWIVKIEIDSNPDAIESCLSEELMDKNAYEEFLEEEEV